MAQNTQQQQQQHTVVPYSPYYKVKHMSLSTILADAGTAAVVGLAIALPVSIIDYSIIAKVREKTDSSFKEMLRGFRVLATSPQKFFLPHHSNNYAIVYRAVATVYFFTYLTANVTRSVVDAGTVPLPISSGLASGIASGAVNIGFTIWKDGIILKVFPHTNEAERIISEKPVPKLSKFLFGCRDLTTCLAAFWVAPLVAEYIANRYPPEVLPLSSSDCGQIVTPAALQFFTTILHIGGIKYHATGGALTMQQLSLSLKENYLNSTLLRIGRIIPAFGIGGIGNRNARNALQARSDGEDIAKH